jgi:hypothetical protein
VFNSKEVPRRQRLLESELERALTRLRTELPNSEDYPKMLTIVERLHELMDEEKPSSVSKDVMLTVAANLLGILLIIKHESVNVISSKALSFVMRPR